MAPLVLALYGCAASATSATQPPAATPEGPAPAGEVAAAQPEPAAAPAPDTVAAAEAPPAAPESSVAHHALLQKQLGFYGVITPPGYDAPENKNKRYPIVVVIHGGGDDERDASKLADALGREGVIYVLPRAPYTQTQMLAASSKDEAAKEPGYTAWPDYPSEWGQYESAEFPTDEIKKLEVPRLYTSWIADTIKDARKRYRATADKVVVVGEGQGAAFAHLLAVQRPQLVKAYFAYAGYYDDTTNTKEARSHAAALKDNRIKVMLVHHADDPVVKAEQTTKLVQLLTERKVEHTVKLLPGKSHELTEEVTNEAKVFVRQWCCGEKPVSGAAGAAQPAAAPPAASPPPAPAAGTPTAGAPAAGAPAAAPTQSPASGTPVAAKSAAPAPVAAAAPPPEPPASPRAAPPKTTLQTATLQSTASKSAPAKPKDQPAVATKAAPKAEAAPVKEAPSASDKVKEAPGSKAKEAPSSDTASKLKDATAPGTTPKTADSTGTKKKEASSSDTGTAKSADSASDKTKKAAPSEPSPAKTDASKPGPAKAPAVTPAWRARWR